jgi:hypothetical protein
VSPAFAFDEGRLPDFAWRDARAWIILWQFD